MTLSLINLVIASLTKDAATCGLQERLLAVLSVRDLLRELFGRTCHSWLLARVASMFVHHHALLCEVELDVIQVLVLVETDLDAASSPAYTLHVVFIECDRNHVTRA